VLSEIPEQWRSAIMRWARFNKRYRTTIDATAVPDRNEEYLLYQTLVGAWPPASMDDAQYAAFTERIQNYMVRPRYLRAGSTPMRRMKMR
jgi:(1->4)-alpha-D-glucan 1-alpha-D-glucosylmutase